MEKTKAIEKRMSRDMNETYTMPLLRIKNGPFLDCAMTCEEMSILYDNRRRPSQWADRNKTFKHLLKQGCDDWLAVYSRINS